MTVSALVLSSWIFYFWFGRTVFQVFPLDCWTSNLEGRGAVEILSLGGMKAEICSGYFLPLICNQCMQKKLAAAGLKVVNT